MEQFFKKNNKFSRTEYEKFLVNNSVDAIIFEKNMESKFRNKLNRMNKELGTTIVLTASNDQNLKTIASVLIYLDNGHVAKIRTGVNKESGRRPKKRKFNRPRKRSIR